MSKKTKNNPASKKKDPPRENPQNHIVAAQQFSGPIPHPDILRQYNEILPGAADRILAMAESESEHQKSMDKTAMEFKSRENRRGQYLAMATVIVAFSAATACAYMGAQTAAAVIGGTTVVGLVTVFVTGRTGTNN
ncbi:MAG: DUF2335 domain-containing protein [Desulfobacteraceae bacterium]|nr:DUF2335 domain-containing protein [Desulfobacteraceae bacterium]